MVTEVVLFDLPVGMTREEVLANYRRTAPGWRENTELVRKTYLYDAEARQGGGVYLWPSIDASERAHDEEWRRRIVATYGSEPVIRYFETPFVVDNVLGRIEEAAGVA